MFLPYLTTGDLLRLSECSVALLPYRTYLNSIKLVVPIQHLSSSSSSLWDEETKKTSLVRFLQSQQLPFSQVVVGHSSLMAVIEQLVAPSSSSASPSSLSCTSHLKMLSFAGVVMEKEDMASLSRLMVRGGLRHLEELNLSGVIGASKQQAGVGRKRLGLMYIMEALSHGACPLLHRLDLSHNDAIDRSRGGMGLGFICQALQSGYTPHLHYLHLSSCGLSAIDGIDLANLLWSNACPQLETLDLAGNYSLGDHGLIPLLEVLEEGHCPNIRSLSLDHTGMTVMGGVALIHALSSSGCQHLQHLHLHHALTDRLSSLAVIKLVTQGRLPSLQSLDLLDTHIDEEHHHLLQQATTTSPLLKTIIV